MAKNDGIGIAIQFSEPLTSALTNLHEHFTISFHAVDPRYPGGIQDVNVAVIGDEWTIGESLLTLRLQPGNQTSLQRAIGSVTVIYDGAGGLSGEGGPVGPFSKSFLPDGVDYKGDQGMFEYLSADVSAHAQLTAVTIISEFQNEHLYPQIAALAVLTHIDDI